MKQRIFSFTALWISASLALYFLGTLAGVLIITAAALFTQLELYQLLERMGQRPYKRVGLSLGGVLLLGGFYFGPSLSIGAELLVISYIILALVIACGELKKDILKSVVPTFFGLTYVPFLLHFLLMITKHAELAGLSAATGIYLTVWVIAVAKATDVGGLLFGMRIGKTPLSSISPAKTYEGAAGGILTSVLLGMSLNFIFSDLTPSNFTYLHAALFAVPIGIASIASDLVESAFKREAKVKDSGQLIPGIGGVFDLTDSLVLTAPLGYLLFKYTLFT